MATGRLNRRSGAVFELSLSSAALEKGLMQIERRVLQFASSTTRAFSSAAAGVASFGKAITRVGSLGFLGGRGPAGLITGAFAGAGAAAALTYPIKLAANIEIAAAQLAVFTGGFDNARRALVDIQQFSAKAFISPENLSANAALLLKYGVGLKDALRSTKALATISAGSSEEMDKLSLAFAQVASTGHLTGEEVRQFKNTAFNPLVEIAKQTGETFQQLRSRMEEGRISFGEVANSLFMAVGPGGRFHGLLESIAKTAAGKFRQAIAQIKLALIPLGDEVLPAISEGLSKISNLLPSLAKILRQNAGLYKQLLIGVGIAAAAGTAFVGLGVAITLAANIAGAFAAVIGSVVSVLGFLLLTKLGLVVTALGGLSTWFLTATNAGRDMVTRLTSGFMRLADVFNQTIGGMADALMAGDLQLAAQVLFAGLQVAWIQGTAGLKNIWSSLLHDMVQMWDSAFSAIVSALSKLFDSILLTFHDVVIEARKVASNVRQIFAEASTIGGHIELNVQAGRAQKEFETAISNAKGNPKQIAAATTKRDASLAEIANRRRSLDVGANQEEAFRSRLDQEQNRRLQAAIEMARMVDKTLTEELAGKFEADDKALLEKRKQMQAELQAALREFEKAKAAASEAAARSRLPAGGLVTMAGRVPIPTGRIFEMIAQNAGVAFGDSAKKQGGKGLATFDVRLIRQMAAGDRIADRQLRTQIDMLKQLGILVQVTRDGRFTFTTQP